MSDSDASSDDERPTNLASSGSDSEPEPTRKRAIEDSDDDDEDKAEEEEEEEEEIEEVRQQLLYIETFCPKTGKNVCTTAYFQPRPKKKRKKRRDRVREFFDDGADVASSDEDSEGDGYGFETEQKEAENLEEEIYKNSRLNRK